MEMTVSTANMCTSLYNNTAVKFGAPPLSVIPRFNMANVSAGIWKVFGHQLFVDGFFSTDPHPGNILVDTRTGALGLIDFGGVLEISLQLRVRYARFLVALANGTDYEVAQAYAQLGVRTRRMSSKLLASLAKFAHGNSTPAMTEHMQQLAEEEGGEPDFEGFDSKFRTMLTSIVMLKGSSMFLGTNSAHYPASMWLDFAHTTLKLHGPSYPQETTIPLDIQHQHAWRRSPSRSTESSKPSSKQQSKGSSANAEANVPAKRRTRRASVELNALEYSLTRRASVDKDLYTSAESNSCKSTQR